MDKLKFYKATSPGGLAFRDGETRYVVGETLTVEDCDPQGVGACGRGLHVVKRMTSIAEYVDGADLKRAEFYEVEVDPADVIASDKSKTRVRALRVVRPVDERDFGIVRGRLSAVLARGSGSGYGSGYGDGDGSGSGYGSGYGDGDGSGSGYGSGSGDGSGYGSGDGDGDGDGYGYGDGYGSGSGSGYGYGSGSGSGSGYGDGDGSGSGYGSGSGSGYGSGSGSGYGSGSGSGSGSDDDD